MKTSITIGVIGGAIIGYFLVKNLDLAAGEIMGALAMVMGHKIYKILNHA